MIKKITIQLLICMLLTSQIAVAQDLPEIQAPKIPIHLKNVSIDVHKLNQLGFEVTNSSKEAFYIIDFDYNNYKERWGAHIITRAHNGGL